MNTINVWIKHCSSPHVVEQTSWSYYCFTPKAHLSNIKLQTATLLPHKARKTLSTVCHKYAEKIKIKKFQCLHIVYENLITIIFFIPCIHRITCTRFSHQQFLIKWCMYTPWNLNLQTNTTLSLIYETLQLPKSSITHFFLMVDLTRNTSEPNLK